MAHTLTLELPDEVYEPLAREAKQRGQTPEQVAVDRLRGNGTTTAEPGITAKQQADALARLKRSITSAPHALGTDNESIDRDLTREYESTHEES